MPATAVPTPAGLLASALEAGRRAVAVRRDFHRHPEVAWTEMRTASLVARRLTDLGFEVRAGAQVLDPGARLGLPSAEELDAHARRAAAQGADPAFLEKVMGGMTAVVGELRGALPGPTVALRVDMDALPIPEADAAAHHPAQAGFASVNPGTMHACGHDGHTAIGLAVAETFAPLRAEMRGCLRVIFQPGEEGGRGALPMVRAGVVDDVDYLLACHMGCGIPSGEFRSAMNGFFATTKLDATFHGQAAHAGFDPDRGRNALLAAAQAVTALHALPRHRHGASRVNVGVLRAGSGRNIIADTAFLMMETRGETAEVDDFMVERARAVLQAAAAMQGCTVDVVVAGSATTTPCDRALADVVAEAAASVPGLRSVAEPWHAGASDDFGYMMKRVQERGGLATYAGIGTDLPSGHHTRTFDIQERDIAPGVAALVAAIWRLQTDGPALPRDAAR
jgi:aminobenzoyl-glutamate utilization protein A